MYARHKNLYFSNLVKFIAIFSYKNKTNVCMYLRFIAVTNFRIEGVGALLIFYLEIIVLSISITFFFFHLEFNTFLLHLP